MCAKKTQVVEPPQKVRSSKDKEKKPVEPPAPLPKKRGRPPKQQGDDEPYYKKFGQLKMSAKKERDAAAARNPEELMDEQECEMLLRCYGYYACIGFLCHNQKCERVKRHRDEFYDIRNSIESMGYELRGFFAYKKDK